ncbi:M48 family peptidase [Parasedimentitalea marina]|uniref:M48 family peptidase n=1 Tax=Parasedimentitalea marina TaxID=2483033 RepID=A0A3T0N6P6_9RHOB|nr:SprT family zinc-dependent metalloprotease [Parasedimentitalea marina]AZV79665.1 M48 family peptidase [Parasedimentitalea marina]
MADHHLPGDPPVPLTLRRSPRARRISLRISALDGRVTLTLPKSLPEREALEFAAEKEGWIRSHLAKHPEALDVQLGIRLPIDGIDRRIVTATGKRVLIREDEIEVPGDRPGRVLQRFLRELARDRLAAASDHYAATLGRPYTRITLRDTRSRWGSCTSDGGLMYSWRLILAPPEVLRYVAAHEVAHLAEMNHSPAFWAQVAHLYGDYQSPRSWLKKQGNRLHRYRFDV